MIQAAPGCWPLLSRSLARDRPGLGGAPREHGSYVRAVARPPQETPLPIAAIALSFRELSTLHMLLYGVTSGPVA